MLSVCALLCEVYAEELKIKGLKSTIICAFRVWKSCIIYEPLKKEIV